MLSLTPAKGATLRSVDCESLTPTQEATQQSVHCESLTPTQGATQQSVDWIIGPVSSIARHSQRVTKSKLAASRLRSGGPKIGRKCYLTPLVPGSPVPNKGDKIRGGYLTPTFSEFPRRVNKSNSGYRTPTFSGAHKWAERLRNPCILRGFQQRGRNQKWLHWGDKDKIVDMQPKMTSPKNFPEMGCWRPKPPLNPPQETILKKWGGGGRFRNPLRYPISENPPPPLSHVLVI